MLLFQKERDTLEDEYLGDFVRALCHEKMSSSSLP